MCAPRGRSGDSQGILKLGDEMGGQADPTGHRFGREKELEAPGRGGAPGLGFSQALKAAAGGWPRVSG